MAIADDPAAHRTVATAVRTHRGLFLAEGIVLVVLGLAALAVPPLATLSVAILAGWLLVISGVLGLVTTFSRPSRSGFAWALLSAIVAIVAGALLLIRPISGMFSLTLVLIAFFVVEGIASIMYALSHRRELPGGWGWMLASGLVDLVLGGLIFLHLPSSAAWAIGLLLGINLIFGGVALIAMVVMARTPVDSGPVT